MGTSARVLYAKGCEVTGDDKSGFTEAVEQALNADAVVVAVGEHEWMSGEAASRSMIGLPGVQRDLIEALLATNRPVVVVLMNGRPLAIPWVAEHAPAILETWFGGTEAGNAIADVLFGDYNPPGKLPVTFPRNEGQIPIYLAMKNTGRPMDPNNKYTSKYLDVPNSPLYAFGYGLSYTQFSYSPVHVDNSTFRQGDIVTVSASVKNTGNRPGEEVVQLYVRDLVGSVTRPVKELKGFKKILLQPGEEQLVSFRLTSDDLRFYTADMTFAAEPGIFEVFVGGDSNVQDSANIELK